MPAAYTIEHPLVRDAAQAARTHLAARLRYARLVARFGKGRAFGRGANYLTLIQPAKHAWLDAIDALAKAGGR